MSANRLYPCDQVIGSDAIYTGSSFKKRSMVNPERSSLSYARISGPNVEYLEAQLGKLYNCDLIALCCSGMNSIGSVVEAIRPRHLVIHNEMYSETRKLCSYLQERNGGKLYVVDLINVDNDSSEDNVDNIVDNDNVDMVLFESCTNPSGKFIEIKSIRERYRAATLIVDNTTLSGAIYNPLIYDDNLIVVESLTKYVGMGHVIAGAIYSMCTAGNVFNRIWEWIRMMGIRISPHDANSIANTLTTLKLRVVQISSVAVEIVMQLRRLPFVSMVCYPGANGDVAEKYIKMGAGMVYFHLRGVDRDAAVRLMDSSNMICYATSYGKAESLFDPYTNVDTAGAWLRLCVGHTATVEGLWNELLHLFVEFSGHFKRIYAFKNADLVKLDDDYILKGDDKFLDYSDAELYKFV